MSSPFIITVPIRVVVLHADEADTSLPGWYWTYVSRHHGGGQAHGPFETRDAAIANVTDTGDHQPFTRGEDDDRG